MSHDLPIQFTYLVHYDLLIATAYRPNQNRSNVLHTCTILKDSKKSTSQSKQVTSYLGDFNKLIEAHRKYWFANQF